MKKGILILATMLSVATASYAKASKIDLTKAAVIGDNIDLVHNNQSDTVTMVVINDAFVTQVLNRDMTIPHIMQVYHYIKPNIKLVANRYNNKAKDTLITLVKGKTVFTFFKNRNGDKLTSANIENNSIATANIAVGLSREEFEKRISVPHVSDVVIIEDKEKTHRFIYTFSGDKVANITYETLEQYY